MSIETDKIDKGQVDNRISKPVGLDEAIANSYLLPTDERRFVDTPEIDKPILEDLKDAGTAFVDTARSSNPYYLKAREAQYRQEARGMTANLIDVFYDAQEPPVDPNFNVLDYIPEDLKGYATMYGDVNNETDAVSRSNFLRYSLGLKESAALAPTAAMIGGFTGSAIDPINAIGILRAPMLVAKGARAAVTAAQTAAVFGGGAALSTGLLRGLDPSITKDDVKINAIAAGILGGAFGASWAKMSAARQAEHTAMMKTMLMSSESKLSSVKFKMNEKSGQYEPAFSDSAGAARYQPYEVDELSRRGKEITKLVTGHRALRGVALNAELSDLPEFSVLGRRIYSSSLMHKSGGADDFLNVQASMERHAVPIIAMDRQSEAAYVAYLKGTNIAADNERLAKGLPAKMSHKEWDEEVFNAAVRKEADAAYKHAIPEVDQASSFILKELKKTGDELIQTGLLKEGATDRFHVPRRHIREEWAKLTKQQIGDIASMHYAKDPTRWDSLDAAVEYFDDKYKSFLTGDRSDIELPDLNMNGLDENGNVPKKVMTPGRSEHGGTNSSLKKRDDRMDTEILAKFGLVEKNLTKVAMGYQWEMKRYLELDRVLKSMGLRDVAELRSKAANSAAELLAKKEQRIKMNPDGTFATKLTTKEKADGMITKKAYDSYVKEMQADLDDLDDMVRLHLGKIHQGSAVSKYVGNIKALATMAQLGMVTLSAMLDTLTPMFRQGFGKILAQGYAPLMKGVFRKGGSLYKLNHDELADLGIVFTAQMNHGLRMFTDPEILTKGFGKTDTIIDIAMKQFGKVTGLDYWNEFQQTMAGQTAFSRIMRAASGQDTSAKTMAWLKSIGINQEDLPAIMKQFNAGGGDVMDGTYIINMSKWGEGKLKDKVHGALHREVRASFISPSSGDTPLMFQRTDLGQLVGQYTTFTSTSQSRILISGLQRRDATAIFGMFMMVMGGYGVYAIKEVIAGREPKTDMATVIAEGLSRSGLLSLLANYIFMLSPYSSGGRYGVNRDPVSTIMGPAAGYAGGLITFGMGMVDGDIDEQDYKNLKKLVPLANIPAITIPASIYNHSQDTEEKDQ